ncbi:PepSY-associated TM helix domain-containing protein [Sphingobacterium corticibacterium]|uniref:PepSY domain-containing protein n=1 Tax=Sphingobacterium corticibacterium TaxID=2484746 RepID=A0A4Q6XQS9_9SPHI|nr:PepSY-associated TM helix domain-containing protein [Sphingobacterium corticibacterium]RZF62693.1 PepSY domain-containing protein [Sphingobacterium corticibacterium]
MRFLKKLNAWLHLWLGLITGLITFIVSITGCLYVFIDEIREIAHRDRLYVQVEDVSYQPLSILMEQAQSAVPVIHEIVRADIQPAPGRTWAFRAGTKYRVYVNPYSAAVVYVEDQNKEFFRIMLELHRNLLLGKKIGQPLVAYSILIFLLLCLSGLVLWWPKKWNRKSLKKSFTVKWKASFKRLNYDLHNVWGFYMLIPGLILAMTGLVYSFSWFDQAFTYGFSGGQHRTSWEIPKSAPSKSSDQRTMDSAFIQVLQRYPNADMISMRVREKKDVPYDFQIRIQKSRTYHFEWSYYDKQTAKLLYSYGTDDLNTADKIRAMNYDLHVGSFMGLTSKIFAFLCSMVCASLPLTGFLIWYNKKWGKKKKRYF